MSLRVFSFVVLAAVTSLHAQEFAERVNVTAVELIANVTDESGRVPDDLKPGDFTVIEDGVERPIIGVERLISEETEDVPSTPTAATPERSSPWQIVVYFDQTLSGTATLMKAAEALRAHAASLTTLGAVEIVVDDGKGARRWLDATTEVTRIEATLTEVAKLAGLDRIGRLRREAGSRSADDDRSAHASRYALNLRMSLPQEARYIARFRDELSAWLGSYTPRLPRALILVSDGFDLDPGEFYASDRLEQSELSRMQSLLREYNQARATDALARTLSVGGWTTLAVRYGIGASFTGDASVSGEGKVSDFVHGENRATSPAFLFADPSAPFKDFAHATGGAVISDLTQVGSAITRLQQRVRLSYQVSRAADDRLRSVEVRSRRPGLRVSTFRWVSSATPENVSAARAVKLLEGSGETPELPLFARFKRAEARTGKAPSGSGTIHARLDLRPIGSLRSKLTAATLRVTVAIERKGAPPLIRHEVVRGYDAAKLPTVDYSAPIEMSNDATKIAVAIEELSSGSWGGAAFDLAAGTTTTKPPPIHLAIYEAFERAQQESKLVIVEFRAACAYCPQQPPDVTAHPAVKRLLDGHLFARKELDAIDMELYRIREFPTYVVFDPWKREFVRWRGDDEMARFAETVNRITDAAAFVKEAGALRNRGDEARAAIALGVAYRQALWIDKAKNELRRVKTLTADRSLIQNAEIHLALTYLREGQLGESIRIARAVAENPVNASHEAAAWLAIGQAKRYQNDERGAVEALSRVEKIAPADSPLRQHALSGLAFFSSNVTRIGGEQRAIRLIQPVARPLAGRVKFQTMIQRADIARVEFVLDGRTATTVFRPPFTARIDLGRVPQEHRIDVIAFAADGREVGRDALTINHRLDDFAVKIAEPLSTAVQGEVSVRAEVKVPAGRRLERVEFLLNDVTVATRTTAPFVHALNISNDAPSVLSAVAVLDDGSRTEDVRFLNSRDAGETVDVHLVELYTSVVDDKDVPVRGLSDRDFTLLEDGKPQTIERFKETSTDPMTVGLAIDTSESMAREMLDLRESAKVFLQRALVHEGRAFVIDFDSDLRLIQSTTSDAKALQESIETLRPDRGTALYDAIIFGLLQFQGVSGKRALVVLTDGEDRASRHNVDTVIDVARESGVPIYFVVLDADRNIYGGGVDVSKALLTKIAGQTGGKAYLLRNPDGLVDVYTDIDRQLRGLYLLTYRPASGKAGEWRELDVRVKKKGMKARAIAGYFAE